MWNYILLSIFLVQSCVQWLCHFVNRTKAVLLGVWNVFVSFFSTSFSLVGGHMFSSLRKLNPQACKGLSVCGCHSSLQSSHPAGLAFLSVLHFLLWHGCHGNGHAHTGVDWAMLLLFLRQHSKNDCICLEWQECTWAHTPWTRHRLWTNIVQIVLIRAVVYVATVYIWVAAMYLNA